MTDPSGATPLSAEELRRVHFPVELSKSTRDPKPVWCAHCGSFDRPWPCTVARLLATLDAALAARDDAGLDVERLARAMLWPVRSYFGGVYNGWGDGEAIDDLRTFVAPSIAREYAALADSTGWRSRWSTATRTTPE